MKTKTLKLSGNMVAIPFTAPEIETAAPASPSPAAPTYTPEAAYEADRLAHPLHHDGTARALWADLTDIARESWRLNPTPRNWAPAAPCPSAAWMPAPVGVKGKVLASVSAPVSPSLPALPAPAKLGCSDVEYMLLTLEQYTTLKADVERLTGALEVAFKALEKSVPMGGQHGKNVYSHAQAVESARLSLAEVGKH
jgi:hypothetical protein